MDPIKLAVGEAALVESPSALVLCLTSGSAEIAGRSLAANEPCLFPCARRGIVLYSLDGGVVAVALPHSVQQTLLRQQQQASSLVRVTRFPAQIPALLPIARSISGLPPGSRVLVLGRRGHGKTLAAQTIVNLLFRDSVTQRRDAFEHVTLITGDAAAAGVGDGVAPGCVSAVRVTRPGLSFGAPFFHETHVTFFRATEPRQILAAAERDNEDDDSGAAGDAAGAHSDESSGGAEAATQGAHWLAQAMECSSSALLSGQTVTVVDAEAPPTVAGAPHANEMHFTNLIDAVDPSLVIFIGGENKRADPDCGLVEAVLRRSGATGANNFVHVPSLLPPAAANANGAYSSNNNSLSARPQFVNDKIDLYFAGSVELPLKCCKMVVPLHRLHFLCVSRENSPHFRAVRLDLLPTQQQQQQQQARRRCAQLARQLENRVCAVSLAAVEAEAAYANVAGLVLIESVNIDENEVVLYAPAGGDGPESTTLVRSFLLVGESLWRYTGSAVSAASV